MAVSGNFGEKVPVVDNVLSSVEQEIYPITSLDKNCIEFEFQKDRNYYVDLRQTYVALKLKFVRGRGYETYNTKEVKKEHKEELKAEEEDTAEEDAPVPLVNHVNNILHSIFSNVEVYNNNHQIDNSNGLYALKSYFSNNFKGAISNFKGVLHCERYDYEEFPGELLEAPLSEPFFTRRMKLLSRPDGFMLYGKMGVHFISTSELLYPNMKTRLRLIRVRPDFYMISDNPYVSPWIVDCSLYTSRIALKDDCPENCHYPELVEEPLRLELNFTFPLEHITELFVLGERMASVAVDKFGVVRKNILNGYNVSLQQKINRIPLLKYRHRGSFPSDYVPNPDYDIFAVINTQPSNMQGEHWIMIANFCQILYFADSLGRKKYSFLKQQYEQMMPEPLQSHPSVYGFSTIYAAFHLFKFRQEEITGVHDVIVLSFISNYM